MAQDDSASNPNSHRGQAIPTQLLAKRVLRKLVPVSVRYRIRTRLLEAPYVSELLAGADPTLREHHRVTRETRIVLDGFPRSANSYARAAFEYANGTANVCSHMHSYRAIQLGVKYQLPTLVLIRDPRPVIASSIQYTDGIAPIHGIRNWVRYYEHILPLIEHVVLAEFHDVVADFGEVVERVNAKFGSQFVPYVKTPEAEKAVYAEIDYWTQALVEPDRTEFAFARPTESRKSAEEMLATLDPKAKQVMRRAEELYERVIARSLEVRAGR